MEKEKDNTNTNIPTHPASVCIGESGYLISPQPNFSLVFGETGCSFTVEFRVNKTFLNRLKWWLFCRVFPVAIAKWEQGESVIK